MAAELLPSPEPAAEWSAVEAARRRVSLHRVDQADLPALVHEAATADLLVLGERALQRWASSLGLVAAPALAALVRCPVVAVPERVVHPRPPLVVVGVDPDGSSASAVDVALQLAQQRGWALRALHAWPERDHHAVALAAGAEVFDDAGRSPLATASVLADHRRLAAEAVAGHAAMAPDVAVSTALVHADPVLALRAASCSAELLVLGQRLGAPLGGPVVSGVLTRASCPVLLVRSDLTDVARSGRPAR